MKMKFYFSKSILNGIIYGIFKGKKSLKKLLGHQDNLSKSMKLVIKRKIK